MSDNCSDNSLFHCIICYNTFDTEAHIPVVLPCGHTYVCATCTSSLKKCMECRAPLAQNNSQPGHAPPYPKNLVLMSLMEVSDKMQRLSMNKSSDEQNDEVEELTAKCSLQVLNGTCGTYSVKDSAGIVVLPQRPSDYNEEILDDFPSSSGKENRTSNKDEKSSRKRFPFGSRSNNSKRRDKQRQENRDSNNDSPIPTTVDDTMPYVLQYGDRVQVVDLKDGWATLARKKGFLYVDASQLVKIGGPEDEACRLEALILALKRQQITIQEKKKRIDQMVGKLAEDLKYSMQTGFKVPMTPPHVFDKYDHCDSIEASPVSIDYPTNFSSRQLVSPASMPTPTRSSPSPTAYNHQSISPARTMPFPSSPPAYSHTLNLSPSQRNTSNFSPVAAARVNSTVSNRSTRSSATAANNVTGLDFRTGMSGHKGLLSTKSKANAGQSNSSRSIVTKMSDHKGAWSQWW